MTFAFVLLVPPIFLLVNRNMNLRVRDAAKSATLLVVTHLAVLLAHGAAHTHLDIGTNLWQSAFIMIVIFVGPLLALGLVWARQRIGLPLLGLSFAGSFIFGVYYHFILEGRDNVLSAGHTGWGLCFRATAVALALLELLGCAWCSRTAVRLSSRQRMRQDGSAGP